MNHYKLVFDGTISMGHDLAEVKQNLASTFKIDETKVERLFTGLPVVLKKNLDYDKALRYQKALQKTGAMCKLEGADHSNRPLTMEKPAPPPLPSDPTTDTMELEISPQSQSATPGSSQKEGIKGLVDIIAGVVLIGIGLVFGGSVFTGDPGWLDYFFDGLGVFWIGKGIYKMVR